MMADKLFLFLLAIVAFNGVVLPNAQKELHIITLFLAATLAVLYSPKIKRTTIIILVSSWITTIFYLIVGLAHGASAEAVKQTAIIYVIAPLLWLLVIDRAWKILGTEQIIQFLSYLSIMACMSVALYILLYLNFGAGAVSFFGSNANVHLEQGYSGIIMHVLGSLIFLGAAFASSPHVLQSKLFSYFVIFSIILAIAVSGRTAAILGVFIGAAVFTLSKPRWVLAKLIWIIPGVIALFFFVFTTLNVLLDVNLFLLLDRHIEKLLFGDVQRPAQISALLDGAMDKSFLGAGHGVGVDYIRSNEFPWRYESVFAALLFKLGILGTIVVLYPLIYSIFSFLYHLLSRKIGKYTPFFGSALLAVTIAGLTNPYPEAVAFQWMYLMPIYYLFSSPTLDELKPI